MTERLIEQSLISLLTISGVLLGSASLVGLVTAVLQAATQIQDQTLSIVPKFLTLLFLLLTLGRWLFEQLKELFGIALDSMSYVHP